MSSDRSSKTIRESSQTSGGKNGARTDSLTRALQECQAIMDAGKVVDQEEFLKKYPDIRDELAACFEGLELMDELKARDVTTPCEPPKSAAGDQLAPSATLGDFRLQRELGRGGMGVVYEAEQLSVGRRVALKVLPYAAMLDKRQVARFQNEARAAATLEHPHIVPVYFVGNDRGVYYYAMRLIEGKNLAQVLRGMRGNPDSSLQIPLADSQWIVRARRITNASRKGISAVENGAADRRDDSTAIVSNASASKRVYYDSIAKIVMQAATALDFAHAHGIVHRDVKPANIMLDELGDAWVTDFGLARIETDGDATMTGDLMGTLRYMSPEQTLAQRVVVDHRTDVYSLGTTLYELLVLQPAFDGKDRAGLLKQIAFEEPRPPTKIDSRIPHDLETIVLKAMQKKPEVRYDNAQDMAEDLQRFLNHQPIEARRTPLLRRFSMWRSRHPLAVTTIALAVAVLLMLAIGAPFLLMQNAAREQAEKLAWQAQSLADANAARAATQEYYASVSEVRELNVQRPVGWTWDALERIKKVAQLDADGKDLLQLRSLAANALIASDVQLIQDFAEGIDPGAVASSPDGSLLAIGEVRPAPNADVARIFVYEVADTSDRVSLLRTLELPGNNGKGGGKTQRVRGGPEGVRSLCFSNLGRRLAVGTRYGQILEWDLESDQPPTAASTAKADENERVIQLAYSPDDDYFVASIGGLDVLRIIDRQTRQYPAWDYPQRYDFFAFAEGGKLLFQNREGVLVEIDNLSDPAPREKVIDKPVTDINWLACNRHGSCGIVSGRSGLGSILSFMDPQCVTRSARIEIAASASESAFIQLGFGPADQAVIGVRGSNQIRAWDALSGSKIFDLPKSGTIYAKSTVSEPTGLWAISGSSGSELFRWRHPGRVADVKRQQRGSSAVLKTFAPGAWPIQDFDLSQDGERIALVESHSGRSDQVRVRSFALHNGQEEGRWTLCGRTRQRKPLRSRGTDVLYTHGGNIIAGCYEVGVPMVLGKNGIQFPAETPRPMVTAQGRVDPSGNIVFEFPETPAVEGPYNGLAIGCSMRFAAPLLGGLSAEGQIVRLDVSVEGESAIGRQLSVEPFLTIGADGWHSLLIANLDETTKPVRLEISIRNSGPEGSVTLDTGSAHLMATLGDGAAHYWLGPYATQGNGKIVAADDGNTITSRNTSLSAPNWKWTDTLNPFATIRAIDAAQNGTVFGTRWGHVYYVDAQRNVRQLNSMGPSHGGDVKEEVASVAIDRQGKRAVSGSLDGKVALYDLTSTDPLQAVEHIQAHSGAVSYVALHRDGQLLATASEDSTLRLWRVGHQEIELWFEVSVENPVQEMQFSPANEQLFFLCRGERGIRVLDLDALNQEFEMLSLRGVSPLSNSP